MALPTREHLACPASPTEPHRVVGAWLDIYDQVMSGSGDETDVEALVAGIDAGMREIVERLRGVVRESVPGAVEELDPSARLIGYTYQPGSYKGLIVAIALHASHVNLMFSKGVELLDTDDAGLLEGTGKKARHIRFREPSDVDRPGVRSLIEEAARRTPRD